MSGWDVYQVQDLDGHWVQVDCNGARAERLGPFETKGQADAEEIHARIRIRFAHGPGAFGDRL